MKVSFLSIILLGGLSLYFSCATAFAAQGAGTWGHRGSRINQYHVPLNDQDCEDLSGFGEAVEDAQEEACRFELGDALPPGCLLFTHVSECTLICTIICTDR